MGYGTGHVVCPQLAAWRPSRSGLDDVLIHRSAAGRNRRRPVANLLLEHVSDALADAGETDTVTGLLAAVIERGNGAGFQRNAYRRRGQLPGVVSRAAAATAR